MSIYTSYFGNYRKFPENSYLLSIALFSPSYFKGEKLVDTIDSNNNFLNVIPTKSLLNGYKDGSITQVDYAKIYVQQLMLVNFEEFIKIYDGSILLCYEKNDINKDTGKPIFCHRHVFRWYANKLGYKIKEL